MAPYCTLQSAVSGTARMVAPEVRVGSFSISAQPEPETISSCLPS